MLLLLKQIRRKLMSENKFTTYFLYAIGEIILVVVGILIAVQIDEWNKGTEKQQVIKTYLNNLETEFETNKRILSGVIEQNQRSINASRRMLNIIGFDSIRFDENEWSEHTTLAFAPIITFQPNETVLSELIASGNIKSLSNLKLKNELSNFSTRLDEVRFRENIVMQDKELCVDETRKFGSMRSLFDRSGTSSGYLDILEGGKSTGNKALLESKVFENNLLIFTASSIGLNNQYRTTLAAIDSLSILVNSEINE